MKKTMLILMFLVFSFSLGFCEIIKDFNNRGIIIDGTTTYMMVQKKDTAIATRISEYPTGTYTSSYIVVYSSSDANDVYTNIKTTGTWVSSQESHTK